MCVGVGVEADSIKDLKRIWNFDGGKELFIID